MLIIRGLKYLFGCFYWTRIISCLFEEHWLSVKCRLSLPDEEESIKDSWRFNCWSYCTTRFKVCLIYVIMNAASLLVFSLNPCKKWHFLTALMLSQVYNTPQSWPKMWTGGKVGDYSNCYTKWKSPFQTGNQTFKIIHKHGKSIDKHTKFTQNFD